MIHKKYWTYNKLDDIKVTQLSNRLGIKKNTSKVLLNRKIDSCEEAKKFLNPSLEMLYDPFLLKDMDKVVYRVKQAIEKNERICIYGDYDVDGIGSTSIMLKYFKSINYPVSYYIPNRMEEGYGLNKEGISQIASRGVKLIITVDCGITSVDEVDFANSLGVDVIITDHHECSNILPNAYGIINPKQKDCSYPFDKICGCGIALKLIQALTPKEIFKKSIYDYIDITAIATIADIVSLTDENRIIVKNGLEYMSRSKNLGIQALLKVCGFLDKKLNAGNIAFGIAPRINAAGRINSADTGVQLLTTDDVDTAKELAEILNEENKYRQEIEIDILNEAINMIEQDPQYAKDKVLLVYKEGWHPGIIGIVASRIVEKYYKPTIVLGIDKGIGKGSARSIAGFNLFNAMDECKELFIKFGGHEQAAGLSINIENIEIFRQKINLIAENVLTEEDFVPRIFYDDILHLEDINKELIDELEQLEPFGIGNPSPKFVSRGLLPIDIRGIGNEGKHLKLKLEFCQNHIDGIGFGLGDFKEIIDLKDEIDLVFSPELNTYNGNSNLQLNIKDIKIVFSKNYKKHPILKEYYKYFVINEYETSNAPVNTRLQIEKGKKDQIVIDNIEKASIEKPTLIIVNTLEQAYRLLSILEYRSNSNTNKISINFNYPVLHSVKYEVDVVINPVIDKIEYKRYNSIIIYDMFYFLDELRCFIKNSSIEKTVFLYENGDERFNSVILDNIIPTREQLVGIYKYLKGFKCEENTYSFEDLYNGIKDKYNLIINETLFNNALSIFSEGKLLKYKMNDSIYNIHTLKPTEKIDINQLRFTQHLMKKKQQHNDFKNKWLQLL